MTRYECNEQQFVENIRRLLEAHAKIVVNRLIVLHDDGRYGLTYLPDIEFKRYERIAVRKRQKSVVYARRPFIDDYRRRFYDEGVVVGSPGRDRAYSLSIPYYRVEHSFMLWGEGYSYTFDVLWEPRVSLEKRTLPGSSPKVLVHVLAFGMPEEETLKVDFPSSVIVLDVRRVLRS